MKKTKNLIIKVLIMILIVFLAMLVSTKVVKANASGKIGDVGTLISNTNELTAINMSLTSTMSVSQNIYNLGITDKTGIGAKGKGYRSRGNLSVDTTYTITYTNAITMNNQNYTLTVTLKPTQKGSGGYISLWISTNNVITVYPYRSKVQVTYTIKNSSGNTVDKYLVYGFGDPDGGNYLFNPTSADIYYKNPGSNSATFKNDFEVRTTGTKGIISSDGNNHDYDDAWIYIAPNNGTSTFTMTLDASMTTSGGDALNLPSLYYSPRLLIFYNMNGGSLKSTHGTTIGTSGNFVTVDGSKSIHKLKSGESLTSSGLADYNNSTYINVGRTGYHIISGREFNTQANGNGTSFSQASNTNYNYSTFSPYKSSDEIVTLYLNWVAYKINIEFCLNGGYLSREHGSAYGTVVDGGNEFITKNESRVVHSINYGGTLPSSGLNDYNNASYMNIKRLGYTVNSNEVYINKSSGSTNYERLYDQSTVYNASDFDDCTSADKTVQLYVNWVPITYNINYTLNGGQNASNNPSTYNIESSNISLSPPTRTGYTFDGWNYSVANLGWKEGFVNINTGAEEASSTYPNSWNTNFIKLKAGVTYTLSGYGSYSSDYFRWRVFDTNGTYLGQNNGGSIAGTSYTPTQDCLVKILMYETSTPEQRSGLTMTASGTDSAVVIPQGSTGNITLTANWTIVQSNVIIDPAGGSTIVYNDNHNIINTMSGNETINAAKTYTGSYNDTLSMGGTTKGPTSSSYNYEITYLGNDGIVGEVTVENVIAVKTVTTTYTFDDWTKNLVNGSWGQTSISGPGVTVDGYIFGPNANMTDTLTATYTSSTASNTTPVILANATRTGYTLKGWYTASSGGTKRGNAGDTYTPSGNETLYAQWTANTATVTIKKDNSNWTTNNTVLVELRSSTNTYNGTKSGATVTWTAIPSGTYNIYASKNQANLNSLEDTGVDVVVTSSGTATIDYYTLTLQKGIGISAVIGEGTFLKGQTANIDATVAAGYTWQGWSVISGNTPD